MTNFPGGSSKLMCKAPAFSSTSMANSSSARMRLCLRLSMAVSDRRRNSVSSIKVLHRSRGRPRSTITILLDQRVQTSHEFLERNVLVGDVGFLGKFFGLRGTLVHSRIAGGGATRASFAITTFATTTQQHQVMGDDFCPVFLFAALFVFPA